ncbi:MAG TPA: helix-turn-helix domain-containing protein [Puia sp.]|nr:helix-turn-helix domain-containing protein [Puia sp.]
MNKRKIVFRSDCPISTALDIFGDKWSLLIIRDLMFKGLNTYGDLLKGGEGIATNILADRLGLLECAGIISKTRHPESKAKVLYQLTPKGAGLAPVLIEIIAWSEKHHEVHPQAIAFANEIKKDKAAVLAQIYSRLDRQ